jgi:hypothetical protein
LNALVQCNVSLSITLGQIMKLDRNINSNGRGKYALLKLRELDNFADPADPFQVVAKPIADAIETLEKAGIIDWGNTPATEFFVMRLKDKYAPWGLAGYALSAAGDDPEYAGDIQAMAQRSGANHPNCKAPD